MLSPDQCRQIYLGLGQTAGLFGGVLLALALLERFVLTLWRQTPPCRTTRPLDFSLAVDTLVWAFPITLGTLLLSGLSTFAAQAIGLDLPRQPIVQMLVSGRLPLSLVVTLSLFALFHAPLMEEGIFRRYLFRHLMRNDGRGFWLAAVASGALFALAHFNAVTFLPLMFFGVAQAWAYHRTGRLAVPMAIHFLFNLTNLLMMMVFPEMA